MDAESNGEAGCPYGQAMLAQKTAIEAACAQWGSEGMFGRTYPELSRAKFLGDFVTRCSLCKGEPEATELGFAVCPAALRLAGDF